MQPSPTAQQEDESKGTSTNVRKIIEVITESTLVPSDKKIVFGDRFPKFAKRYPMLFDMVCDGRGKTPREGALLEMMLQRLDAVHSGDVSQHKASEQVGQVLFDEFVAPKLSSK